MSTPAERRLAAQEGGYAKWANVSDRTAATAPARKGWFSRFEKEVDPDGTLEPGERALRATSAMKAHMTRMSRRAAQSRSRKKPRQTAA